MITTKLLSRYDRRVADWLDAGAQDLVEGGVLRAMLSRCVLPLIIRAAVMPELERHLRQGVPCAAAADLLEYAVQSVESAQAESAAPALERREPRKAPAEKFELRLCRDTIVQAGPRGEAYLDCGNLGSALLLEFVEALALALDYDLETEAELRRVIDHAGILRTAPETLADFESAFRDDVEPAFRILFAAIRAHQ